jgi:hypothetical protein
LRRATCKPSPSSLRALITFHAFIFRLWTAFALFLSGACLRLPDRRMTGISGSSRRSTSHHPPQHQVVKRTRAVAAESRSSAR